ncbi:MAG TPA: maleylpyruvate isomerase N-terminal domain-containing protein, partial [bacterium]|nr:maleylpyruvate isomerase N-terminal domain-containing protein [bacterium]
MNPAHARLLSQLAAATERFLSDVAALPDLNRQPDAGGWSATQVIRHLMGSEAGITALLAKQAHKAPSQLPRAGLRSWL